MRVRVDDDSCAGHGVCVALCPEVFTLTDDGYAQAVDDDVDPTLQGAVTEAIDGCPERAIFTDHPNDTKEQR
ncbi:ferredoxin [Mycobacterium sp. SMC-4]|uniref:ferredoxin n=1 Tax=Mycobacterium sp. SMC-4 TaxID=2857059 RepID=UPI003D0038C7